jgi:predicted DNA-binding antitoxin AbrB/MazE fold protein
MVQRIDGIFTQGIFRPLEPIALPEGTRVRLSIEVTGAPGNDHRYSVKIHSPKLAHKRDAARFIMVVHEAGQPLV